MVRRVQKSALPTVQSRQNKCHFKYSLIIVQTNILSTILHTFLLFNIFPQLLVNSYTQINF
jgi:hypothetical protein